MDKNSLEAFIANIIRTCTEQAKDKKLSKGERDKALNESLMQFYKILAGYTNGNVDYETYKIFVGQWPGFAKYLSEMEQRDEQTRQSLRQEKAQLEARLVQIEKELKTPSIVTKKDPPVSSSRIEPYRGGGRC